MFCRIKTCNRFESFGKHFSPWRIATIVFLLVRTWHIEFIHTERSPSDLAGQLTFDVDRHLWRASVPLASTFSCFPSFDSRAFPKNSAWA